MTMVRDDEHSILAAKYEVKEKRPSKHPFQEARFSGLRNIDFHLIEPTEFTEVTGHEEKHVEAQTDEEFEVAVVVHKRIRSASDPGNIHRSMEGEMCQTVHVRGRTEPLTPRSGRIMTFGSTHQAESSQNPSRRYQEAGEEIKHEAMLEVVE